MRTPPGVEARPLIRTRCRALDHPLAVEAAASRAAKGETQEEDDDPLKPTQLPLSSSPAPPPPSSSFSLWSLTRSRASRAGKLAPASSGRSASSTSKAWLARATERLDELSSHESSTKPAHREPPSSRRRPVEYLERARIDFGRAWSGQQDRAAALKLLVACLDETMSNHYSNVAASDVIEYTASWVEATCALDDFAAALADFFAGFEEAGTPRETDRADSFLNFTHTLCRIKSLVTRLYVCGAVAPLAERYPGFCPLTFDALLAQSRGVADPIKRALLRAYLVERAPSAEFKSSVVCEERDADRCDASACAFLIAGALEGPRALAADALMDLLALRPGKDEGMLKAALVVAPAACISTRCLWIGGQRSPFLDEVLAARLIEAPPRLETLLETARLCLSEEEGAPPRESSAAAAKARAKCAVGFLEVLASFYPGETSRAVSLLREVERRLRPLGRDREELVLRKRTLLASMSFTDAFACCTSEPFARIYEDLPAGAYKLTTGTALLRAVFAPSPAWIADPLLLGAALNVACDVHDALAVDAIDSKILSEQRGPGNEALRRFVSRLLWSAPPAARQEWSLVCRRSFPSHDGVTKLVLHSALRCLRSATSQAEQEETLGFVHATIPSLSTNFDRAALYMAAGHTALETGRFYAADGLIKSAVACVAEGCEEDDEGLKMLELVSLVASGLVCVPGFPSPFYFVKGLSNAVERAFDAMGEHRPALHERRAACQEAVGRVVRALSRGSLPYRVRGRLAQSNEVLYADGGEMRDDDRDRAEELIQGRILRSRALNRA